MASSMSSSDEEDVTHFAEIVNIVTSEVIQNGFPGRESKSVVDNNDQKTSRPSLRHWKKNEDDSCSTSEFTTPEFRKHIAKKLSRHLDDSYICTQVAGNFHEARHEKQHSTGIKLLLSSRQSLLKDNATKSVTTQRKEPKSSTSSGSSDDEEEIRRLSEAAVSGYSIIQQVSIGDKHQEVTETEEQEATSKTEKTWGEKKTKRERKHRSDSESKPKKRKKHKKEKHQDSTL